MSTRSRTVAAALPTLKINQKGGCGSDWSGNFHAPSVKDVQALSSYTLQYINESPMFHPLQFGTVIPTITSGITPTGAFYWNTRNLPQ